MKALKSVLDQKNSGLSVTGACLARRGLIAEPDLQPDLQMDFGERADLEVLEIGIHSDQLFGAEHVPSTIRLPDHLEGHQVGGGGGAEDA